MIQDFTNPHGEMKPSKIITHPEEDFTNRIRVVRKQGLYYVQIWEVINNHWVTIIDERTGKLNQFQTIQEAENLITRIKKPREEYYY